MKEPSRFLAGVPRIAVAALFLFLVAVPRGFAQITDPPPIELKVVGDNTPIDAGQYCGKVTFQFSDCFLAQAFSLSSGAYVNQVRLTLIANPSPHPDLRTGFLVEIAGVLDNNCPGLFPPCEPLYLARQEFFQISASPQGDQLVPFTDSFPAIYLPKGSYYLLFETGTPNYGHLTWAANQIGSSEIGLLGQSFCNSEPTACGSLTWAALTTDPTHPANLAGTNGTFAFELDGPMTIPPNGGGYGQIARLVAGPVRVAPGAPVEATLGFLDMNGNPIGRTSNVTLGPGQIESLDLNLSQFVNRLGQRIEVQPVITQSPDPAGASSSAVQLPVTVQILDALTGFETVLTPVLQPGASAPALVPQVLAGGQTMRIDVTASAFSPCNATLGFANDNGVSLGSSIPVRLSPGTGTSLDLNSNTVGLGVGKRIEVLPIVTPTALPGTVPVNSVCEVSAEVFDRLTGRTQTSQSTSVALPAAQ